LKSLTDGNGRPLEIGDERDIGEFNDTFLSRVQEGLNYKKIYEELKKKKLASKKEEEEQKMQGVEASPNNNMMTT